VVLRSVCEDIDSMSPKYHDLLVSKIGEESPEYSLLKNAVIIDHSTVGVLRKTMISSARSNKLNNFAWWQADLALRPHLRSELAIILHRRRVN
jgi:hypothetical protein